MRNPLKRQPSAGPKPTLRERAAALKATAGRVMHPPKSLPAPDSEAAREAFEEACREHARETQFAHEDYPDLKRTSLEWWTKASLSRARELGEISAAECARLYPRASEREMRIDAVSHRLNVGALHALAYANDPPMPPDGEAETDQSVDWQDAPAGFMAYPTDAPAAFHNISLALPLEAERLNQIAQAEFKRRSQSVRMHASDPGHAERVANLRRLLRVDAWAAVAADPEAAEGAHPDADLLALEAEFIEAHRVVLEVSREADDASEKFDEPAMPRELRVWQNDWLYRSIPRPGTIPLANGMARSKTYGAREVEILRSHPCTCIVHDGREVPDPTAQARADAIVAAWDQWRAEIAERREALNLPALYAKVDAAEDHRRGILRRLLSTSARSLDGIGVKGRIALAMSGNLNPKEVGAKEYDPEDFEAFIFDLAGDALALASDNTTAGATSMPATPAISAAPPAYDLSDCTVPQLARLYEAWESMFHHLNTAGMSPCFLDIDRNFNSAGEVLDQEYDRAETFLAS